MKEKYNISFSGGRTSAYMTWWLINELSWKYDFIVTFANTGLEHPMTLEFVDNCDRCWGFNTVWLEADTQEDGVGTKHKIVTYETASRNGEPFEEIIQKYGIANHSYLHCTREMKLAPMRSYLKSIGVNPRTVKTALGIRYDEPKRVKENDEYNLQYPLATINPMEKGQVLEWWKNQPFDLGLEEFEGNCLCCFKKSNRKLFQQIRKDPTVFDFTRRMEKEYGEHKAPDGRRVWFRGNLDTKGLFELHDLLGDYTFSQMGLFDADESSCSTESCEVF